MMEYLNHGPLKVITSNIPEVYLTHIQKLLDLGLAPSRSEYIRWAIGNQITRDLERQKQMEGYAKIPGPAVLDPEKFIRIPHKTDDDGFIIERAKVVKIVRRLDY